MIVVTVTRHCSILSHRPHCNPRQTLKICHCSDTRHSHCSKRHRAPRRCRHQTPHSTVAPITHLVTLLVQNLSWAWPNPSWTHRHCSTYHYTRRLAPCHTFHNSLPEIPRHTLHRSLIRITHSHTFPVLFASVVTTLVGALSALVTINNKYFTVHQFIVLVMKLFARVHEAVLLKFRVQPNCINTEFAGKKKKKKNLRASVNAN